MSSKQYRDSIFKYLRVDKQIILTALVVIVSAGLTGCGKSQAKQDSSKNYATSTSSQSNSPYQNLLKTTAEQVKKADSAVSNVYDAKVQAKRNDEKVDSNTIANRPANYIPKIVATAENKATKAIAEIKGNDTNTKDIRQAYTDVVNVVKDSSLINMQTARSHIALLKDSELATHMEKEFETPMANNVAQHTSLDISTILNETKPLSEKKLKAAQEKAAASAASSSSDRAAQASAAASAATSSAASSTTKYQFSGDAKTSANTATSRATQATATPSTGTMVSRSTTGTTVSKGTTATTTSKAASSSYHNNIIPRTSTSAASTQNGTGNNTTAGYSMSGGW
ncbi:hypothetical protein [Liquorilactobacillus mali]|uniref:hypothetical protein n=1 Tax=Liquorilactobacillus mali TaxID=1618 RepID=UPI00295459A6|nr:hypothetical protein [Liquorilactobacillus mali]MDV7757853.1 hypothetical protein [Liquorilactobacillus mali]